VSFYNPRGQQKPPLLPLLPRLLALSHRRPRFNLQPELFHQCRQFNHQSCHQFGPQLALSLR